MAGRSKASVSHMNGFGLGQAHDGQHGMRATHSYLPILQLYLSSCRNRPCQRRRRC